MDRQMDRQIVEEPISHLAEHGRLPISFRVDRHFEVTPIEAGLGGMAFRERKVARPYLKDYDAIEGGGPTRWALRWDIANWGLISAFRGDRVGGAVLAFDTPGLDLLEGRKDLAVLWDIRVHPGHRRHGLGRALFLASEAWARARGCRRLKVETQNINVPACRFYAGQGCVLGAIDRFAYPDFPDEVQLLWYKDLADGDRPAAATDQPVAAASEDGKPATGEPGR
jgi:GNAT superfamily N-acetyltransferase